MGSKKAKKIITVWYTNYFTNTRQQKNPADKLCQVGAVYGL